MRRVVLALAAVAVAVPLGLVPAHASAQPAPFLAGAARADITPPPAGRPGDPADCDPTAAFTGMRQLGLEEPYQDLNGNGRYDAPDPTNGVPGEPFLDCPTPTALGGTRPPDGRWDGNYLGGGDCCDRLATGAVLDRIEADAVVVSDGHRRVALVSVDNEGVFKEIWDEVRAVLAKEHAPVDAVLPASTHDESAPDTIGITGPTQTTSAVDPFYVELLVRRVADAVEQASRHLVPARIRYGAAHADTLMPCWSSYPFVADENVGAMQVVSTRGSVVATMVSYGIHAEELGFAKATQHDISGDWWHFLRTSLRRTYGDRPVLAMGGPMGSVEMPRVLRGAFDPVPTGVHRYASNDGCTTIYSGPAEQVAHESGYRTYTKALGEEVARWARVALARGDWSRAGGVSYATRTIMVPVTNVLFLAAAPLCVFDYRVFYTQGVPTGPATPPACGAGNQIDTDLSWFRIGDGSFVTAPGELFPATYLHDLHGPEGLAVPSAGPVHGWVMSRLGGRWRFVQGLGGDLSGYVFPANNAVGVPTAQDPNASGVDRFGCHHVDDGEASSGNEGDVVDDALLSFLPSSPQDVVRPGRYLWRDGSAHRDPTGQGVLGCDAATAGFVPAPGGGATAVRVRSGSSSRTYVVGRAGATWMDLDGRRQAAPSQQTRGVVLGDGTRVWVDVYPS